MKSFESCDPWKNQEESLDTSLDAFYSLHGLHVEDDESNYIVGPALEVPLMPLHLPTSEAENTLDELILRSKEAAYLETQKVELDFIEQLSLTNIRPHPNVEHSHTRSIRSRVAIQKLFVNDILSRRKTVLNAFSDLLKHVEDEDNISAPFFSNHCFDLNGIDKNIASIIMSFCDIRTTCRLSRVNKWWSRLSRENGIYWKNELLKREALLDLCVSLLESRISFTSTQRHPAEIAEELIQFRSEVFPLMPESADFRELFIAFWNKMQKKNPEPKHTLHYF
jgi:hypothetical protein